MIFWDQMDHPSLELDGNLQSSMNLLSWVLSTNYMAVCCNIYISYIGLRVFFYPLHLVKCQQKLCSV